MKIAVNELTPYMIDYAIARALHKPGGITYDASGVRVAGALYRPSTTYNDGGELLDKFQVDTYWHDHYNGKDQRVCEADVSIQGPMRSASEVDTWGPTLLCAACRAVLAFLEGEQIEIPDELVKLDAKCLRQNITDIPRSRNEIIQRIESLGDGPHASLERNTLLRALNIGDINGLKGSVLPHKFAVHNLALNLNTKSAILDRALALASQLRECTSHNNVFGLAVMAPDLRATLWLLGEDRFDQRLDLKELQTKPDFRELAAEIEQFLSVSHKPVVPA